jgi:hypothetical protein
MSKEHKSMKLGYVPTASTHDAGEKVANDLDDEVEFELLPKARERMLKRWDPDPLPEPELTPGEKLFQQEFDEIENERLRIISEKAVGWAAETERNAKIKANEKRRADLIARSGAGNWDTALNQYRGVVEPDDEQSDDTEQSDTGQSDTGLDPNWVRNADPMTKYAPKPSSVTPVIKPVVRRVSLAQGKAAAEQRKKELALEPIAAAIRGTADEVERGKLLIRAQALSDHGRFLQWLATIPNMSERTAYRAIAAAKAKVTKR